MTDLKALGQLQRGLLELPEESPGEESLPEDGIECTDDSGALSGDELAALDAALDEFEHSDAPDAETQLDAALAALGFIADGEDDPDEDTGGDADDLCDLWRDSSRDAAVNLARDMGFDVVGCGSTRVGVVCPEGIAKVARDFRGLALNLQEAAVWLTMPERFREVLVPCVALSPELVVIQERVEALRPNELELAHGSDHAFDVMQESLDKWFVGVEDCRAAMGFTSASERLPRFSNFGVRAGGRRVLAIDYGEKYRPWRPAWTWMLWRLQGGGPLTLDSALRDSFFDDIGRMGIRAAVEWAQANPGRSLLALARRAGIQLEAGDPCPVCRKPLDGDHRCLMNANWHGHMCKRALILGERPSKVSIPPARMNASEALAEQIAVKAGIPQAAMNRLAGLLGG